MVWRGSWISSRSNCSPLYRDTFNQTRLLYLQGCVGYRLHCTCGAVCAGDGLLSPDLSARYPVRRERGWVWKPWEQPLEHLGRTGHGPVPAACSAWWGTDVLYSVSTRGVAPCSHATIISDVPGTALPYSPCLSKCFGPYVCELTDVADACCLNDASWISLSHF